eukprot:COSAG02_NODE_13828_length_1342_cov_65.331456_1_plen_226_part_00
MCGYTARVGLVHVLVVLGAPAVQLSPAASSGIALADRGGLATAAAQKLIQAAAQDTMKEHGGLEGSIADAVASEPAHARRQLQEVDCVGTWSNCSMACTRVFTVTTEQANGGRACDVAHNSVQECLGSGECRYFELPSGLPSGDGVAYIQHTRVYSENPAFTEQSCSVAVVVGDFGGAAGARDIYVINRYCDASGTNSAVPKNQLLLHDLTMVGSYGVSDPPKTT